MPTLTAAEIDQLKRKVSGSLTPLCQTVAKLYLCPRDGSEWKDTGVWGPTCVVIDRTPPKAILIQIFDIRTFELKFSQEVYELMPYQQPNPQFHTFEIDGGIAGLSFADKDEAEVFRSRLFSQLPKPAPTPVAQDTRKKSSFLGSVKGWLTGKSSSPAPVAAIGLPTNVVHKQHIGYDPTKGFDCSDIPAHWKSMFRNAGVRKKDLQNPETAKLIYETLQQELGGAEAAPGGLPPDMIGGTNNDLAASGIPLPPLPGASAVPTATAPPRAPPATPAQTTPSTIPEAPTGGPPEAPPMDVPDAPPFDAPPFDAPPFDAPPMDAPPAPVLTPSAPVALRLTAVKAAPRPAAPSSVDHLSAIRSGVVLKKIAAPEHKSALPDLSQLDARETNSLMGALQSAMATRLAALKGTGDGASGNDEDDWSDND